jgi:hypothetical protein
MNHGVYTDYSWNLNAQSSLYAAMLRATHLPTERAMKKSNAYLIAILASTLSATGCVASGGGTAASNSGSAPASAAPPAHKVGPGMDTNGNVIDPSKVEAGYGQNVKGLGDWEGEITGIPAPGSRFAQLQIGMPMRQVMDIVGPPTDEGSYITGKAFIPFYYGSDRYRYELVYKGQGRLIFAGGSINEHSGAHLTWIINSAADTGYR